MVSPHSNCLWENHWPPGRGESSGRCHLLALASILFVHHFCRTLRLHFCHHSPSPDHCVLKEGEWYHHPSLIVGRLSGTPPWDESSRMCYSGRMLSQYPHQNPPSEFDHGTLETCRHSHLNEKTGVNSTTPPLQRSTSSWLQSCSRSVVSLPRFDPFNWCHTRTLHFSRREAHTDKGESRNVSKQNRNNKPVSVPYLNSISDGRSLPPFARWRSIEEHIGFRRKEWFLVSNDNTIPKVSECKIAD